MTVCCRLQQANPLATVATDPAVPGRPGLETASAQQGLPGSHAIRLRSGQGLPGILQCLIPSDEMVQPCNLIPTTLQPLPIGPCQSRGRDQAARLSSSASINGLPATSQPGRAGAPARSRPADLCWQSARVVKAARGIGTGARVAARCQQQLMGTQFQQRRPWVTRSNWPMGSACGGLPEEWKWKNADIRWRDACKTLI